MAVPDGGWEYSWYQLGDEEPVRYQPSQDNDNMKMNPVCESLQVLRLGHLGPRYEIVPFLLAALPKIKTLGAISVLNGLKMIRDIPALKDEATVTGLEEITLDIVNRESGHNKLTAAQWAGSEIRGDIDSFFESLDRPITSVEEKRRSLEQDISLITSHCPNLRSISLFLFLEEFPGLLRPAETWVTLLLLFLSNLHRMKDNVNC